RDQTKAVDHALTDLERLAGPRSLALDYRRPFHLFAALVPFRSEPDNRWMWAGHDAIRQIVGPTVDHAREEPVRDDEVLDREHGAVCRTSRQHGRRDRRDFLRARLERVVLAVDVVEHD